MRLLLAKDIGQLRDLLVQAGAEELLQRTYPTTEAAVAAARELRRPDPDRC